MNTTKLAADIVNLKTHGFVKYMDVYDGFLWWSMCKEITWVYTHYL